MQGGAGGSEHGRVRGGGCRQEQAAVGGCRGSSVGSLVVCSVFPMSSKSSLCKNRTTVFILNFLVFFAEHDGGDGL